MVGAVIGNYQLVRKLGQGGMGVVYLGQHVLLGRRAAIKVLLPALSARTDVVSRFFNEARAVTSISDLGIVQIFDFGHHTDGSAFIVMEFLEGEPLDHRLARMGRLPVDEALRLCRQVAGSLAAAHTQHIIHRDLKPENIFLVRDAEMASGERTKILDFGIAKLSDEQHPGNVKTHTGMLVGTPKYMSPEQCRGIADIDHRSDIYALGCVLFHLLAGRPPFEGEGIGDIISAHIREPAPPPSSQAPGIPPRVDALVLRCLAKAPADRFQTMVDLAAALGSLLQQMPAGAPANAAPAYHSLPTAKVLLEGAPTPTTLGAGLGQFAPAPLRPRRIGLWIAGALVSGAVGTGLAIVGTGNDKPKDSVVTPQGGTDSDSDIHSDAGAGSAMVAEHPNIVLDAPAATGDTVRPPVGSGSGSATATVVTPPAKNPCDTMDVEDVMKQASNQFSAGYAKAALQLVAKALACKQTILMYRMAGMYACAAHDLSDAKLYFNKLPASAQAGVEQKCQLEGLNLRAP